jgi:hypothetical protein
MRDRKQKRKKKKENVKSERDLLYRETGSIYD